MSQTTTARLQPPITDGHHRDSRRAELNSNPIVLPGANDASSYSASIGNYAKAGDPGDTLTISKGTNAPAWLSISASGAVTASPTPANVGTFTFSAIVTDQTGASATTSVQLAVTHVAPQWTTNPINLPGAVTGTAYSQSVVSYVNDPHTGDTLTYSMTGGPTWATINATTGVITGTPTIANIGANTWQLTLTDPLGTAVTTTVNINVTHLPPVWSQNPIVLPNANDASTYSTSIASDVAASDPNDTITITGGSNVPAWLTIAANGNITATLLLRTLVATHSLLSLQIRRGQPHRPLFN